MTRVGDRVYFDFFPKIELDIKVKKTGTVTDVDEKGRVTIMADDGRVVRHVRGQIKQITDKEEQNKCRIK